MLQDVLEDRKDAFNDGRGSMIAIVLAPDKANRECIKIAQ